MKTPVEVTMMLIPCDRCRAAGPTPLCRVALGAFLRGYFLCAACQTALRACIDRFLQQQHTTTHSITQQGDDA
jgi:hypothetical protein